MFGALHRPSPALARPRLLGSCSVRRRRRRSMLSHELGLERPGPAPARGRAASANGAHAEHGQQQQQQPAATRSYSEETEARCLREEVEELRELLQRQVGAPLLFSQDFVRLPPRRKVAAQRSAVKAGSTGHAVVNERRSAEWRFPWGQWYRVALRSLLSAPLPVFLCQRAAAWSGGCAATPLRPAAVPYCSGVVCTATGPRHRPAG